jgi:glutamate-ammonia-ligase adenylyltransferase
MIKARPVAGDITLGNAFLERIKPFVWRRNLDFAAIEDVHAVKRQIHDTKGHGRIAIAGHDIKVGRGGIREIEFFIQTQQLIIGGREAKLRQNDTCGALRAFAEAGRLSPHVARDLIAAYRFLRRLEHRLQMIADEQTHRLPKDEAGLARVATFMGYAHPDAFRRELKAVLSHVQKHYDTLFEPATPNEVRSQIVLTDIEDDPAAIAALHRLGFNGAAQIASRISVWHRGLYRASRSERARKLLIALTPTILAALAKTVNPDFAFAKLDEFLGKLPAGVQLFALFQANPSLIDLAAEIMGSAPSLAERLTRDPSLFDQVLEADFYRPLPSLPRLKAHLGRELAEACDFQDVLDITRRFVNRLQFRVGVQMLQATISAPAAGRAMTDIAEAALALLLPQVVATFAETHGTIGGGEFAIIGMGTLGAREMTFGSDLDLVLVYDHPTDAASTKGRYPLSPGQYYTRLSQRLISALTAPTAEGQLYAVDMRLRPSGNAGPVAVHRETFRRYQRDQAWTFEHMALTRARVIAGSARLTRRLRVIIAQTLRTPREPLKLVRDVVDMRARIDAQYHTRDPWSVKYVRGGMVDLDFITQYLLLRHAATHADILANNSGDAIQHLRTRRIVALAEARCLDHAYRLLYSIHAGLRLCTGKSGAPDAMPDGLKAALARISGTRSFRALAAALRLTEKEVLASFKATIRVSKNAKTRQSAKV